VYGYGLYWKQFFKSGPGLIKQFPPFTKYLSTLKVVPGCRNRFKERFGRVTLWTKLRFRRPIKLVVAKCWDPNPKGYFTIPRTEPVRPIDPGAWVAHTAAIRGEGFPLRPPSVSTLTSTSSSVHSTLPDTESKFNMRRALLREMHQLLRQKWNQPSSLQPYGT